MGDCPKENLMTMKEGAKKVGVSLWVFGLTAATWWMLVIGPVIEEFPLK